MHARFLRYTLILGLAAVGAGCHEATTGDPALRAAAGLYLLATVNGQQVPTSDPMAAIGGSIYLSPSGKAERHVTFRTYNGGTEEVQSAGSFRFENDSLVLELAPKIDPPPGSWRVNASLVGGTLRMGYPGPTDAWMNEEYRRQW